MSTELARVIGRNKRLAAKAKSLKGDVDSLFADLVAERAISQGLRDDMRTGLLDLNAAVSRMEQAEERLEGCRAVNVDVKRKLDGVTQKLGVTEAALVRESHRAARAEECANLNKRSADWLEKNHHEFMQENRRMFAFLRYIRVMD